MMGLYLQKRKARKRRHEALDENAELALQDTSFDDGMYFTFGY